MHSSSSRNRLCSWFLKIAFVCLATNTVSALANNAVVVGSFNPQSQAVTLIESRFVRQFADGRPIDSFYTIGDISNGLKLVRSGKTLTGSCFAEVFSLAVVAGGWVAVQPEFEAVFRPIYTYTCTNYSCDGYCLPPVQSSGSCTCGPIGSPSGVTSGEGQCLTQRVPSWSYLASDLVNVASSP